MTIKVKCPDCKGSGLQPIQDIHGTIRDHSDCKPCLGSGEVDPCECGFLHKQTGLDGVTRCSNCGAKWGNPDVDREVKEER